MESQIGLTRKQQWYWDNAEYARERARAYYHEHKEEQKAKRRAYYEANRDKMLADAKIKHLRRSYGITPEERTALEVSQNGRCGICGNVRELVIDHDHQTGKVRGLLCRPCNSRLNDADTEWLERALKWTSRST